MILIHSLLFHMVEGFRSGTKYVMTLHAEEEMNDDGLSIFDVEHCLLTGEIIERQKDRKPGEWKYLVSGETFKKTKLLL